MERDMEQLENDVFELVRKAEDTAVEAGRKWAKAVGEMVPLELPLMRQVVKEALDFTDEVLKLQRQFALKMMQAMGAPTRTRPERMVHKEQPTKAHPRTRTTTHPRTRTTKVA